MKKLPSEYFYIDKDGNTFYKRYKEKKVSRGIDQYTLASTPVVFGKDVTINTIYDLVRKNVILRSICFYAKEFLRESLAHSKYKTKGNIVFCWEDLDINETYPMTNYPKMEVYGQSDEGESFGIEFLGANDIKDLGIIIDTKQKVVDGVTTLNTVDLYPTLFQVVYGLFWELSFFGDPKSRKKEAKNIFEIKDKLMKEFNLEDFKND